MPFNLPCDFLSPTQIEMYYNCPMQYYLRYVLGIKAPPIMNLIEGATHHTVLQINNKYKIETGKDRPVKYLVQKFCDMFNDNVKDIPKETWKQAKITKDGIIKRGKYMIVQYQKYMAPYLFIHGCEEEIELIIKGIKVLGYADVVATYKDEIFGVFDYKISAKPKSGEELAKSIALSHYGLNIKLRYETASHFSIRGKPDITYVGFITLKKVPDFKPIIRYMLLTKQRVDEYKRQVIDTARAITTGLFPKKRNCNPMYCDHGAECRRRR